jgi:hypothetical protein
MPDWVVIVVVVLAVLVVALAVGGGIAVSRRRRSEEPAFEAGLEEANRALAAAHAEDKGWEPAGLREAARRAFEDERPGVSVRAMSLVQVVDLPGVQQDEAVFRFETGDGAVHHLTLGRTERGWRLDRLS